MNFFMVREGGSHQAIQKELDIQGKANDSFYREGPSPNAELKGCTSNSLYCHLAWLNRCLILSTHAKPPTIDRTKSCSDEIRSSQGAMADGKMCFFASNSSFEIQDESMKVQEMSESIPPDTNSHIDSYIGFPFCVSGESSNFKGEKGLHSWFIVTALNNV